MNDHVVHTHTFCLPVAVRETCRHGAQANGPLGAPIRLVPPQTAAPRGGA
jgi:hypothetical protein